MKEELHAADVALRAVPVPLAPAEDARPRLAEEQLTYAGLLDTGMKLGLLLITATFVVYATGLLPAHVPVEDLPLYWAMPVKQHLAATGTHAGWAWVHMLHKGDFLNLVGVAFLSGVTMFCYAAIVPIFLRKKDRIYASIAVLEILVLALAASGVLNAGAH